MSSDMNLPTPNSASAPTLITVSGDTPANDWVVLADDEPIGSDGPYVLGFDRALSELDGLNGRYGVRVLPGQDVRQLASWLDKIALFEVAFPGYRDGRGYSTARILRQDLSFTGPVRAVGDVLRDQLLLMARCGFDQFVIKDHDPAGALTWALGSFTTYYQSAADAHLPTWALRHQISA
ncbi:DUF934 domain-containing protein [Asticcacaulis sp. EMRT-3]|uniref:DUF934 domain-containing protein n=1 Tax=Asticcacaulis sp. EMRT-3 TaxID=3040349 RepID=UPI0024AF2DE3|nr:DUF934 domain-containing protein [Asticcacaulis sp. EMRT-3]MDI7775635.1 DUF934 domain-containing protein [Asticcacaulis sp. EMRT-3]